MASQLAQDGGPLTVPSWITIGSKCRWWSESQKTHHSVVVTSVDPVKRRVVVHFEADHSVWKTVPYSHLGGNGPLRPPASLEAAGDAGARPAGAGSGAGAAAKGGADEADGTATPPWYEQLNNAESREQETAGRVQKDQEEHQQKIAAQERRRYMWQQEQQRKVDEERKHKEEQRDFLHAVAEVERLRIVEKLKKEREDEQRRQFENILMGKEDEASSKMNAMWRTRELVARRQRDEEDRERREEEQFLLQQKLEEDMANRPRVSFGVKVRSEPAKFVIPQQTQPAQVAPQVAEINRPTAPMSMHESIQMQQHLLQQLQQPSYRPPQQMQVPRLPPQAATLSAQDFYGMQIRVIYHEHNPGKLSDVPELMAKYAGCEEEMYERICEKYGVAPVPPPSNMERSELPPDDPAPPIKVGFARKASAPAPPRSLAAHEDRGAPSANSLLARFQNLVGDLEDDSEEEAFREEQPDDFVWPSHGAQADRQDSRDRPAPDQSHGRSGSRNGGDSHPGYHYADGISAPIGGRSRAAASSYSSRGDFASSATPASGSGRSRSAGTRSRGDDAGRGRDDRVEDRGNYNYDTRRAGHVRESDREGYRDQYGAGTGSRSRGHASDYAPSGDRGRGPASRSRDRRSRAESHPQKDGYSYSAGGGGRYDDYHGRDRGR